MKKIALMAVVACLGLFAVSCKNQPKEEAALRKLPRKLRTLWKRLAPLSRTLWKKSRSNPWFSEMKTAGAIRPFFFVNT